MRRRLRPRVCSGCVGPLRAFGNRAQCRPFEVSGGRYNEIVDMPTEPKPRSKSAAEDPRGELLTPWLIAVAMGLAALVLFGSIERNLETSRAAAAGGATAPQVGVFCQFHTGATHQEVCR